MAKKHKKSKHNLNKMKGTKVIMLILAFLFVVPALIGLAAHIIMLINHPFL